MPHDINGEELKIGDIVNIPCRIKQIHLTGEYCNVTVETCGRMFPSDYRTEFVLNSKQVEIKNVKSSSGI